MRGNEAEMIELAPSILAANIARLGEDIEETKKEGIRYIHVDVMDGMFVPSLSFGFPVIESIRPVTDQVLDVHLMIQEPIRYIKQFAKAGSDFITVHYEACSDLKAAIDLIHECGCKCGISVSPETPVSCIYPYLSMAEMVLIMTVRPGFGGQKYIDAMTEKIKNLKAELKRQNLTVPIEVDGGIHSKTIETVLKAGAEVIVCGSAVFSGNIRQNIRVLQKKIHEFEVSHENGADC